ncbi:hypothetical protein [Virgibacillus halodenitrificans]|uniref:hypothetical protein n=1 Tax=Virgibacillus halodenitrificans TaxID=1482 RepID=UPI000EF500E4|nr:hypothetical protein [Virgibacillus halodenitrificans]
MIDYKAVRIAGVDFGANGLNEVYQNLQSLYTTPEGTVPFDRGFGINTDFLDEPLPIAKGKIMMEYRQKTQEYEPRAIVDSVTFEANELSGYLTPKVVISIGDNT